MLFQVTHVHSNETCPGRSNDVMASYSKWWHGLKDIQGIKVLAGYVSPMDHTFHITVEADDYPILARAMGPLNTIGSGTTHPVIPLDQAIPMAETGAFRMQ